MLHEPFVEPAMLDAPALALDVPVAHMDLRGLREARELLVRRLGRDDAGRCLAQVSQAHGEPALIERMKLHEARPGLIEHDVVAKPADALEDALSIVNRAVVGALLDHRGPERALLLPRVLVLHQRIGADALADRGLVEVLGPDRADEPVGVAVGRKEDRNAARHQKRALMGGLVVVAIEQDQVALGDEVGQHDLVRGRGAVEHEIGLLRPEDRGGLFLRLQRRPFVGEEIAKLENGIIEVVAKDRLAQVLDENASDRAAAIEYAAVVAGAGPKLVAFFLVVDEAPKNGVFSVSAYCLRRETRFLAMNSGVSSAKNT